MCYHIIFIPTFSLYASINSEWYHIAENFRGRKLSRISRFCGYSRKFSLQNLGVWHLWCCKSEQSAKVFSAKIVLFTNPQKFSPSKFPAIQYFCPSEHVMEELGLWCKIPPFEGAQVARSKIMSRTSTRYNICVTIKEEQLQVIQHLCA